MLTCQKLMEAGGNPWCIDEPMKQNDNMLTCQKLMEAGEIPGT